MTTGPIPFDGLDSPAVVLERLSQIERDLATRQNNFEASARSWYKAQREIRRSQATALLTSEKASVTEKKAAAELASYDVEGAACEAEYEALKAVIRVLETRGMICMAILKAQGRS